MRTLLFALLVGCGSDDPAVYDCAELVSMTTQADGVCLLAAAEGTKGLACPAVFGVDTGMCSRVDVNTVSFGFVQTLNGVRGLAVTVSKDQTQCEFRPCL